MIDDETFVMRASEFIISKRLSDRNYIYYKSLATSVDTSILQEFFRSVLDSIHMNSGRVSKIIFKNGLSHSFTYSE